MEGQGDKPVPESTTPEKKAKTTKMLVIVVVVILIVAAIAGAFVILGQNKDPTAVLEVSADQVNLGDPVEFNATKSSDNMNTLEFGSSDLTYEFFYGDGNSAKVNSPVVEYTYTTVGNMLAWVVVKDSKDGKDTSSALRVAVLQVNVVPENNSKPVPVVVSNAEASENIVPPGTLINFTGSNSYKWIWNETVSGFQVSSQGLNYNWAVDGVSAGSSANLSRNFTAVGNYVVKFTVIDSTNTSLLASFIVTVVVEEGSTGGTVKRADTFVEVTIGEPDNLDPAVDYETAGHCQRL
jgi:hypothetical protein